MLYVRFSPPDGFSLSVHVWPGVGFGDRRKCALAGSCCIGLYLLERRRALRSNGVVTSENTGGEEGIRWFWVVLSVLRFHALGQGLLIHRAS